jgi:hypothetical protein
MGTDISLYIEKRDENKNWVFLTEEDLSRNYILFAILANEEDGFEIISENFTKGIIPISKKPRGIPQDVSKEVYEKTKDSVDYLRFTPSWVTLKEIIDYPHWDTYFLNRMYVNKDDYQKYKNSDNSNMIIIDDNFLDDGFYSKDENFDPLFPDSFRKHVRNKRMEELIIENNFKPEFEYNTIIVYKQKYKMVCKQFYDELLPKLMSLDTDFEGIRLVYSFW